MTAAGHVAALAPVVERELARWSVPGIVVGVLRDGEVATRAFGVAKLTSGEVLRDDALFRVASISKVFTATLAMLLADDGLLDLDAPVARYLPDLRLADEAARRAITMHHLLSHQSGLHGDFFVDLGLGEDALARAVARFYRLRQWTAPGELWAYCNSGFHLAGRAIEVVAGQSFDQVMRERLFAPLGLERACFFAHEAIVWPHAAGHNQTRPGADEHISAPQGYPRNRLPAGGVIANAPDLLRFAAFHLGDGTAGAQRLLPAASLRAMREPQIDAGNFADAWGIGWDIRTIDGARVIAHGGSINGFQTQLTLVPEQGVAVAILTNSGRGSAAIRGIEAAALAECCGLRASPPARVALPDAELARFAGRYTQPLLEFVVTVDSGALRVAWTANDPVVGTLAMPPLTLAPLGGWAFVVTGGEQEGSRVEFIPTVDRDGEAVRFIRVGGRLADKVT